MTGMQKFERVIKLIVVVISLVGIWFIYMRVRVSRSLIVDPRTECESAGRSFDPATQICRPR